jgi:hypothetical protein
MLTYSSAAKPFKIGGYGGFGRLAGRVVPEGASFEIGRNVVAAWRAEGREQWSIRGDEDRDGDTPLNHLGRILDFFS